MPISLQCTCGKAYRVKDELAGKRIRCAVCKELIVVPEEEFETPDEDVAEATGMKQGAPPPVRSLSKSRRDDDEDDDPPPRRKSRRDDDDDEDDRPRRKSRRYEDDDEDEEDERPSRRRRAERDDPPKKKKKKKKKAGFFEGLGLWKASKPRETSRRVERTPLIVFSPTIIAGFMMMLGAVVWFVVGLALGILFCYPPILFVIGLVTMIKGFMGYEG